MRTFHSLPESERSAVVKKRLVEYCKRAYRKVCEFVE